MILHYQTQKQILDEWCWAAVASSVSFYYNSNSIWFQSRLAGDLLDSSCNIITIDNADNAPISCQRVFSLQEALVHTNNFAWPIDRYLSLDEIRYQINNGWPIGCQISWEDNQNHFIVIYGYEGNSIVIGDPQAGNCSVDYTSLRQNYRSGKWIRSYGTQAN